MINLGGLKVDPTEVEEVLAAHGGITEAAVYPGVRREGGEVVEAAVVSSRAGLCATELRSHCLALLQPHKIPERIHFDDQLPRTPSGKVLKRRCPRHPAAMNEPGVLLAPEGP